MQKPPCQQEGLLSSHGEKDDYFSNASCAHLRNGTLQASSDKGKSSFDILVGSWELAGAMQIPNLSLEVQLSYLH